MNGSTKTLIAALLVIAFGCMVVSLVRGFPGKGPEIVEQIPANPSATAYAS